MMKDINLLDELNLAENNPTDASGVLTFVNELLEKEALHEQNILNALSQEPSLQEVASATWFPEKSIYSIESIEEVAVKFRLRFLESFYFKTEIPQEAISRIKTIEKQHNITLKQFYVLAPAKHFKLSDCNDDPLLFIPLDNGKFHLIHQWGKDMRWYKKWLSFPLRNLTTLIFSLLVISVGISALLPSTAFASGSTTGFFSMGRIVFFLWLNLLIAASVSYIWFAFHYSFSTQNWRSKFFND
jgi:hypothetical protein